MEFNRIVRIVGSALSLGGAVLLVAGLAGIRRSTVIVEELSYLLSGGIGGLFFVAVGITLVVIADLGRGVHTLGQVEERIRTERAASIGRPATNGANPH